MPPELQEALALKLLTLADDEMILAHRNSEWSGHGPILEEDIAFTNIALDEMGHAATWYQLYESLTAKTPDELIFFREAAAYRNVQMVEYPIGDWAFSMLRQYLFDVYEMMHLEQLEQSSYQPLAAAAAKIRMEEIYHLRHTQTWVRRLGLGTAESRQRLQQALDQLWPSAHQLFVPLPVESLLIEEGIVGSSDPLYENWWQATTVHLIESGLTLPGNTTAPVNSRSEHTPHLPSLLDEMQSVARLDPEAQW